MANDTTTITFIGNLTADPELKFTDKGDPVANFTVANTARYLDKATNQWVDGPTTFLKCGAFRDLAEHITESLTKGMRVVATGRLRQHHWETKEGEKRSMFVLDVDEIGASLKWATVTVTKAARSNGNTNGSTAGSSADVDPWAGDTRAPVSAGAGGAMSSEPPF